MITAGSCRTLSSDPDKPNLSMPGLFDATINTTRLFLTLFLHLCHVVQCKTTTLSVQCNTSKQTRAQGTPMYLQRLTLDVMKEI